MGSDADKFAEEWQNVFDGLCAKAEQMGFTPALVSYLCMRSACHLAALTAPSKERCYYFILDTINDVINSMKFDDERECEEEQTKKEVEDGQ